jgi:hypothetical protein
MNETVTAFLKVSHNLVRTGMQGNNVARAGQNISGGRIWPAGRSLPVTAIGEHVRGFVYRGL